MPRVKRGVSAGKRHRKLLSQTKGYKHGRKKLYRRAKEAWLKAGEHAYRDRRNKKRVFRGLWIIQLNAAAREQGLKYSEFINGLKKANIELDRKVLAQLAQEAPEEFAKIATKVKTALKK